MADKKSTGKCRALIVTGCLTERYRDTFLSELPEADAALGTGEYGKICEVADFLLSGRKTPATSQTAPAQPVSVHECSPEQRLGHLNADRVLTNASGYVYIKISEGCDNNCAYCAIPTIRGPRIDRPQGDIISEAERLSAGRDMEVQRYNRGRASEEN